MSCRELFETIGVVYLSVFAEKLRSLRIERNLMSKTMAELLSITPRNYQRYETGDVDPPTSKTIFLADYFDVSLDYLVGRSEVKERG